LLFAALSDYLAPCEFGLRPLPCDLPARRCERAGSLGLSFALNGAASAL
jgi:hypothetical protein